MVRIRTLNELSQLRNSEFNQSFPRHGLNLLYWFAKNCNVLEPTTGAYGFHQFYNRIDDDDDRLLPDQNLRYYEVGNLNAAGAENLPGYVRQENARHYHDWNKDRIIVRVNQGCIDRVYVTEHADWRNFSHDKTYRVSQGLLDQIRGISREDFLKCMQRNVQAMYTNIQSRENLYTNMQSKQNNQERESSWSWCTIL